MTDVLAIRYKNATIWSTGRIEIITKNTMARTEQGKKPVPYMFSFAARQEQAVLPFYGALLTQIQLYKGSKGTVVDGWWTWPEAAAADPAEKENALSGADSPEKENTLPEADSKAKETVRSETGQAEKPVVPPVAEAESRHQAEQPEEKRGKGPACPECGCTSIFPDKDADGVIITCLNCGRQWRPGQHRSW